MHPHPEHFPTPVEWICLAVLIGVSLLSGGWMALAEPPRAALIQRAGPSDWQIEECGRAVQYYGKAPASCEDMR